MVVKVRAVVGTSSVDKTGDPQIDITIKSSQKASAQYVMERFAVCSFAAFERVQYRLFVALSTASLVPDGKEASHDPVMRVEANFAVVKIAQRTHRR